MFSNAKGAVLLCAVALAGCTHGHGQTVSPDLGLGEAVKFNAALQTVNPDPVYGPDGALPGGDADRAVGAVERYREGKVTPVEEVMTTQSTSGGGGGSSQ